MAYAFRSMVAFWGISLFGLMAGGCVVAEEEEGGEEAVESGSQALGDAGTPTGYIQVNYADTRQTIHGFGGNVSLENTTAFTINATGHTYGLRNDAMVESLAEELFGPTGLNVTFLRVSNWWKYKPYSSSPIYATRPRAGLDGTTSIWQGGIDYTWWFEGTKRAMREFKDRQGSRGGKIMMTSWSPPPYLKDNGSSFGGTLRTIGGDFDYAGFAEWWRDSLRYYPVLPDQISIQNEPDFRPSRWEGCRMTPSAALSGEVLVPTPASGTAFPIYNTALTAVKNAISPSYPGVRFIGPDVSHTGDAPTDPAWKVEAYTNNITTSNLGAIAHHLYQDNPHVQTAPLSALNADFPYTNEDRLAKYATEYNGDGVPADGSVMGWMHLARSIHNVMTHESANAYLVWDLVDGFVSAWPDGSGVRTKTALYYALAHYSKYVNPDDMRVTTAVRNNSGTDNPNVWASAYRHYRGPGLRDQVIIVLINTSNTTVTQTVRTSTLWDPNPAARWLKIIRTSGAAGAAGSKRLTMDAGVPQNGSLVGDYVLTLPGQSLTTVIVN